MTVTLPAPVTYPNAAVSRGPQGPGEARAPKGTPLSERERDVLELVSRGHSNAAIGKLLYLSEDTVKTYCRKLFRRLDVADRAHATRRGFELGLLTADPRPVETVPARGGVL